MEKKVQKNICKIQRVKRVNIFPYTIGLNISQTGEYRMIALILIRHVPFLGCLHARGKYLVCQ